MVFDGQTRQAIAEYRRLLAGERSPDELAAGLREWGSGEARIVSARLLDGDGDERFQFAGGEAAVVELVVTLRGERRAARRVSLELRDNDGVVLAGRHARRPASSAGRATAGRADRCASRSSACRSPRVTSTCAAALIEARR